MKYILIIGKMHSGKSTSINKICHDLKPEKIKRFKYNEQLFESIDASTFEILNGSYLIEVEGKLILVMAGAATEQGITVTALIEICIKLDIKIHFAIVAMRSEERKQGFDTVKELEQFGECVLQENISKIDDADFQNTVEWKARIDRIVRCVKSTLHLEPHGNRLAQTS